MTIWYVGGKSAGHIVPLITLAQQSAQPAVFITTHRELDKRLLKDYTGIFQHCALYLPDFKRKKFWLYPWYMFVGLLAMLRLFMLWYRVPPQKIFSTGGLCAVPVFLYARIFRIPCELFELNALPGDAVRFLLPLSNRVFYCYKTAAAYLPHKNLQYKPYPVRIFSGATRYEAAQQLGLNPRTTTICFLGGSQGSSFINELAVKIVSRFATHELHVVHQTGPADYDRLSRWYQCNGYTACVVDYSPQIELFYSVADLVICRAGAGTLWELEYMNTRTCIIPLKTSATDHQIHNAQALCLQKPEQFTLILQQDAERNIERIRELLNEKPESQWHASGEDPEVADLLFHE